MFEMKSNEGKNFNTPAFRAGQLNDIINQVGETLHKEPILYKYFPEVFDDKKIISYLQTVVAHTKEEINRLELNYEQISKDISPLARNIRPLAQSERGQMLASLTSKKQLLPALEKMLDFSLKVGLTVDTVKNLDATLANSIDRWVDSSKSPSLHPERVETRVFSIPQNPNFLNQEDRNSMAQIIVLKTLCENLLNLPEEDMYGRGHAA